MVTASNVAMLSRDEVSALKDGFENLVSKINALGEAVEKKAVSSEGIEGRNISDEKLAELIAKKITEHTQSRFASVGERQNTDEDHRAQDVAQQSTSVGSKVGVLVKNYVKFKASNADRMVSMLTKGLVSQGEVSKFNRNLFLLGVVTKSQTMQKAAGYLQLGMALFNMNAEEIDNKLSRASDYTIGR